MEPKKKTYTQKANTKRLAQIRKLLKSLSDEAKRINDEPRPATIILIDLESDLENLLRQYSRY